MDGNCLFICKIDFSLLNVNKLKMCGRIIHPKHDPLDDLMKDLFLSIKVIIITAIFTIISINLGIFIYNLFTSLMYSIYETIKVTYALLCYH